LSGTVTVNHADGETLKLRSRSGRGEWYRSGRGKRDFVREVRVASLRERWVVSVMEMRVVSIRKSEWRWSLRGE
jgi:hypothetical protein